MKLPFSIHFLGWWLTGENWLTRGQSLPKPSLSISPNTVIIQGGNVSIRCQSDGYSWKLFELHKVAPPHSNTLQMRKEAKNEATFQILKAQTTNRGLYVCRYCIQPGYYYSCSDFSNTVKIFVTEQLNAVPSLSASPSTVVTVGENITFSCKSDQKDPNATFHLYKDQSLSHLLEEKKEQDEAAFLIANATPSDGGIYQCRYCLSTEFSFSCSLDSNGKHIFLRDPCLPKPSIKAFPCQEVAPGLNVTIECQGTEKTLNVSLYKSSTRIASQITEPGSNTTRFFLSMVNYSDTGSYACQYLESTRPFVWSPLSDLIEMVVRDSGPPKPTIKLRPQESIALGRSVTLECWGPEGGLNASLQQPSNSTALWLSESTGNTTRFSLAQVRLEDAGRYTCRHQHRDNPFVWSEPSEPVLLVVRALSTAETRVRLAVAVLVLLAMLLIVAEAMCSWKKEAALMNPE